MKTCHFDALEMMQIVKITQFKHNHLKSLTGAPHEFLSHPLKLFFWSHYKVWRNLKKATEELLEIISPRNGFLLNPNMWWQGQRTLAQCLHFLWPLFSCPTPKNINSYKHHALTLSYKRFEFFSLYLNCILIASILIDLKVSSPIKSN